MPCTACRVPCAVCKHLPTHVLVTPLSVPRAAILPYNEFEALLEEVNEVGRANRTSAVSAGLLYCGVCCPIICEKKGNSKRRKEQYSIIFNVSPTECACRCDRRRTDTDESYAALSSR